MEDIMKWISVREELPEKGQEVLVFVKSVALLEKAIYDPDEIFKWTFTGGDIFPLSRGYVDLWCEISDPFAELNNVILKEFYCRCKCNKILDMRDLTCHNGIENGIPFSAIEIKCKQCDFEVMDISIHYTADKILDDELSLEDIHCLLTAHMDRLRVVSYYETYESEAKK